MNKSKIEAGQPGTEADSSTTAQNQHVSQPNANTNVVGSLFKSREIKFRFWLAHTKKMTYEHNLIEIAHAFWDFTEDIIPLQYTGLKDKNGKEIYESDIVEAFGYYDIIEFRNGSFGCFNKEQNEWILNSTAWTVAGNIFETTELLDTLR